MSENWNLGSGLGNVCKSVMEKLRYAGFQLEERDRIIINVDSYEVTAMIWAMREYQRRHDLMEGNEDGKSNNGDV